MSPWFSLILAALTFAIPLVLAAVGELVVERAGVVNISIEGMMLAGALAGWAVDGWKGPAAGLVAATLAGMTLAVPFATATLRFATDQIVTGTGINLLALGVTGMVYKLVPDAIAEKVVPADRRLVTIGTPILALMVWTYFRFTRSGLELAAIGESPQAAATAGVGVNRRKFMAILFGAGCAGLAGSFLSIMNGTSFTENMTDGRGFLALAIVIFGRWNVGGVVAAGLFFGVLSAFADHLETFPGIPPAVLRLFGMLPFVVSLAALAGIAGKSGAPAALGKAYVRE